LPPVAEPQAPDGAQGAELLISPAPKVERLEDLAEDLGRAKDREDIEDQRADRKLRKQFGITKKS